MAPRKTKKGEQAPKSAPKADAPPPPQVTYKFITAENLNKLLRATKSLDKQKDEVVASLREKIAYAKEKQFLNTEMFGLFRRLMKKEPEQLARWYAELEHYWEITGLKALAESAPGLPLGEGEEDGDEEDEEQVASNVSQLRRAAAGGTQPDIG